MKLPPVVQDVVEAIDTFGVDGIALMGSYAREEQDDFSDVDIMIFTPTRNRGGIRRTASSIVMGCLSVFLIGSWSINGQR